MMTFLDKIDIKNTEVKFWSGFDLNQIMSHSIDGSDGYMIILVESINKEKMKFQRESKINQILGKKRIDFDNLIDNINNNYVSIYQSNGEDELIVKILKEKFDKNLDWQSFQRM